MAEDDFRRWEREIDPGTPEPDRPGGRTLALVAVVTAAGCAGLIAVGDVPLGAVGLAVSSLILVLWRFGF